MMGRDDASIVVTVGSFAKVFNVVNGNRRVAIGRFRVSSWNSGSKILARGELRTKLFISFLFCFFFCFFVFLVLFDSIILGFWIYDFGK